MDIQSESLSETGHLEFNNPLMYALVEISNRELQGKHFDDKAVQQILQEERLSRKTRNFLNGKLQLAKKLNDLEEILDKEISAKEDCGINSYDSLIAFLNRELRYNGSTSEPFDKLKNTGLIKYSLINDPKRREQIIDLKGYRRLNSELKALKSELIKFEKQKSQGNIASEAYTADVKLYINTFLEEFKDEVRKNQFYMKKGEATPNYLERIQLRHEQQQLQRAAAKQERAIANESKQSAPDYEERIDQGLRSYLKLAGQPNGNGNYAIHSNGLGIGDFTLISDEVARGIINSRKSANNGNGHYELQPDWKSSNFEKYMEEAARTFSKVAESTKQEQTYDLFERLKEHGAKEERRRKEESRKEIWKGILGSWPISLFTKSASKYHKDSSGDDSEVLKDIKNMAYSIREHHERKAPPKSGFFEKVKGWYHKNNSSSVETQKPAGQSFFEGMNEIKFNNGWKKVCSAYKGLERRILGQKSDVEQTPDAETIQENVYYSPRIKNLRYALNIGLVLFAAGFIYSNNPIKAKTIDYNPPQVASNAQAGQKVKIADITHQYVSGFTQSQIEALERAGFREESPRKWSYVAQTPNGDGVTQVMKKYASAFGNPDNITPKEYAGFAPEVIKASNLLNKDYSPKGVKIGRKNLVVAGTRDGRNGKVVISSAIGYALQGLASS